MATQMKYVKCNVAPGFFDSELYVMVGEVSALVNARDVKPDEQPEMGKQVPGLCMVYLVTEEKDRALVELPGQPVVGGLRTWLPKGNFVTA